jgi:hypothetical protein
VLTGKDKEQMRVTPEGRVGIGTDKPEATLDVAGTIRARGIRFDDGTVLTSAGTANRISKWLDGAGTLGDSAITESAAGNVGIGTTTPATKFDLVGPMTLRNSLGSSGFKVADRTADPGAQMGFSASPGSFYSVLNTFVQGSTLAAPKQAQFSAWTSDIDLNSANATQFAFRHDPNLGGIIATIRYGSATARKISLQANYPDVGTPTQLVLDTNGNVGVGTATPASKLTVAGVIESTTGGIKFPDGTVQMTTSQGSAGPQGPQGATVPAGPQGATGPQGAQGQPGPAVHTSAVCVSAFPNAGFCFSSSCSCSNGTVSRVSSPCTVTSDTGTCSASSCGSSIGQCCVCKP